MDGQSRSGAGWGVSCGAHAYCVHAVSAVCRQGGVAVWIVAEYSSGGVGARIVWMVDRACGGPMFAGWV